MPRSITAIRQDESAQGFAGNGLSRWTRDHERATVIQRAIHTPEGQTRKIIHQESVRVTKLRAKLQTATGAQRDKIATAIEIKVRFIQRLQAELDDPARTGT